MLRANSLSNEAWGAAMAAGLLGLISLVLFSGLLNRIVKLPLQDVSEMANIPFISVFFMIIMGSVVAGVVEESAFRGYMQKPIEQKHGPVLAIVITGIIFSLMHYSHAETTLALMPFYFFVATIYGVLAYITNSILPGMILHAAGDVFGGLQVLLSGQSEWQTSSTPQPLIWETGIDTSFILLLAGMIFIGAITVWAYIKLAKEVKNKS
jgi:membrane protease YdiL (CAAX protease family)